jgi:hypothetical protein
VRDVGGIPRPRTTGDPGAEVSWELALTALDTLALAACGAAPDGSTGSTDDSVATDDVGAFDNLTFNTDPTVLDPKPISRMPITGIGGRPSILQPVP